MTPRTATPPPRSSIVARFGPLAVILLALGAVAWISSSGTEEVTAGGSGTPSKTGSANAELPVYYQDAKEEGDLDQYDFGDACDPATGRIEVPSLYAPPCVAARPDVKRNVSGQGVTDTEITVVAYVAADDDLAASLNAQLDTPEDAADTSNKIIEMFAQTYETWGREIKVVRMKGTGSDETSARSDAVKVAEEIKAFASIGGPGQEGAYAEELARRGVVCVGCGLALPDSALQKNAPYLWGNLQTPEQYLLNLGDFIIERLLGKKAEFAGSPEIRSRERVFGVVHFEQDPPVFGGVEEMAKENGESRGYEQAVNLTYQLVIADLPEKARVLVDQLKKAKVTSVVFLGDPIMPIYLTKAATDQDYFPEWIITGTVLTDTTVFGRLYDQKQWAHAFGVSSLPARLPQDQSESWRVYEWFYGEPPAAKKTVTVINEPIRLLMAGIHQAGPKLTPETFRDGLFAYPPSGGKPTNPRISWGDHDLFRAPDFNAVDDMQVIWWNADLKGLDEQGEAGTGMMMSADGGRRYLPGEMPHTPANVFDEEGAVAMYDELPADAVPPSYPSPGPGG
ncbi:hypothetical protein ACE2AJ_05305 [Aquihabitans daechungensis]|uniref:hypothetical protein n=1 Tax=Aquihabitans daechungensis TaxID=1052257 RepID=UPI003B9F85B3